MSGTFLLLLLSVAWAFGGAPARAAAPTEAELLARWPGGAGPALARELREDRAVVARARLGEPTAGPGGAPVEGAPRVYEVSALMETRRAPATVARWLTDGARYPAIVSYITRATPTPREETRAGWRGYWVEGGIFGYWMRSRVEMREREPGRTEFEVREGHFLGMTGRMTFAAVERDRGVETLTLFESSYSAAVFPPRFVLERGAEIVFGWAGRRMRNWIESHEENRAPPALGPVLPQPRRSLF